ncbi:MAG: O-antigen ligase family protein [Thermoleophilia bacterium]
MRDVAGAIACLAPVVVALVLAFQGGGYFLSSWGIASAVLLGVAAVAPHVARGGLGGPAGIVALAGWGGLAAWQGVSAAWADEPAAATAAMGLTALYGAAAACVMVGLRRPGWLRPLGDVVLLATAAVVAYGACARMLPGTVSGDEEARLSAPISYWNGLGALAAFGLLLAVGLAGHPRRGAAARAGAAALVPLFALTLLFTLSRGAVLALLVGLALLVAIAPGRLETVAVTVLTLAASAPLLIAANDEEGLVALKGPLPEHADPGRRILLYLLLTAAACAVAGALAALGTARLPDRLRPRVGWCVGAVAVVAVIAGLAARPPDGGPIAWADRQVDSFTRFNPGARTDGSIADRLAVAAGSGRWQQWEVAGAEWRDAPIAGTGAGDYRFAWNAERPIDQTVQNAHSLYLEVMAESGLIGLVLLLLPAGAALWAIGRAARRGSPDGRDRDMLVAVAAGAVIALHMMGDWDWQLPAVVLPAIVLGTAAMRAALHDLGTPRDIGPVAAWSISLPAVVLLLLVIGPALSAGTLDDARRLAAAGDLSGALAEARTAARQDPQSPAPRLLEANVLADLGRPVASDRAFAAARARSPRDWVILADWATALALRGDRAEALRALRAARALNPREPRLRVLAETLAETGAPTS